MFRLVHFDEDNTDQKHYTRYMVKIYCYSKCSTCKKALKWLDESDVQIEQTTTSRC